MNAPTLAGFTAWVYSVMGVPTSVLPSDSPYLTYAFDTALYVVNRVLQNVVPHIYVQAVYNLGGDNLANYAQDASGAPPVPNTEPPLPYWANMRRVLKINDFISGVIQSASDEGTSESMIVQEAARNFTLANIQNLKTPWGRRYLSIAQDYGPSVWGLS